MIPDFTRQPLLDEASSQHVGALACIFQFLWYTPSH
jgi:hypothetical protein